MKFFFKEKTLLDKQIDVFLSWAIKKNTGSSSYKEWLDLFCRFTAKTDILDVTDEDVDLFMEMVDNIENGQYRKNEAYKAIFGLRRYYMARGKNGNIKLKEGRPPRVDKIEKVQEYRKKGLAYRDIAKLVGSHLSLVYRWSKYPLEKVIHRAD